MRFYDLLTSDGIDYDARAIRYLEIMEDTVKRYDKNKHQQLRAGLINKAIKQRVSLNTKESLAMASALWQRCHLTYPALLKCPKPVLNQ